MMITNRAALAILAGKLEAEVETSKRAVRHAGATARRLGFAIQDCPHAVGSWMGNRWMEGWSGTMAPERTVVDGAFNMTPADEVSQKIDWALEIGLSTDDASRVGFLTRRGYRAEALTGNA